LVSLTLLGALIALGTFYAARSLKRSRTPVVAASVATAQHELSQVSRYSLRVNCPGSAQVTVRSAEGVTVHPTQSCPALEFFEEGEYHVLVEQEGYRSWVRPVTLNSDLALPEKGTLALTRITGVLTLAVEPSAAAVWVDGEPFDSGAALVPGPHRLRVSHRGYTTQDRTVVIPAGGEHLERVVLSKVAKGRLHIIPPRSGWYDVYFGKRKLCSVPPVCSGLTLPVGRHHLTLRHHGGERKVLVKISEGRLETLDLSK